MLLKRVKILLRANGDTAAVADNTKQLCSHVSTDKEMATFLESVRRTNTNATINEKQQ